MNNTNPDTTFNEHRSRDVAVRAANEVGLDGSRAELIRIGEHAMFRLPDGVVARVARGPQWSETADRELKIARMLAQHDVPCGVPIILSVPTVDGHPVTFWAELDTERPTTFAEIGHALRKLHAVPVTTEIDVPELDAFHRVRQRIMAAWIDEVDRTALVGVLEDLQSQWASVSGTSPLKVLHGDPHSGNVLLGQHGPALIDLETVSLGPAEWDLALPGTYHASLRWIDHEQYDAFVTAYGGVDVTTSPHFSVLRRIRELRMTSWLLQHAHESARIAQQVKHRIACLVDDDLTRHWFRR